jgi:hypothetical protein
VDAVSYILILMLSAYGSDGGNALTTAHFETYEACVAAGQKSQSMGTIHQHVSYRCVPTR